MAAGNVNAFVGQGGPYWVIDDDGMVSAPADPGDAIGLRLEGLDFGLALLKPTDETSGDSWYALRAEADDISLVGVEAVALGASMISLEVNGSSTTSTSGNPPSVVDFIMSFTTGLDPGNGLLIESTQRALKASGTQLPVRG